MPLFIPPSMPIAGVPSGRYLWPSGANSAIALTTGQYNAVPLLSPGFTASTIGLETTVTSTGGAVLRLGVYQDANGIPGPLLFDSGTVTSSCAAGFNEIAITQSIPRGLVWGTVIFSGAPAAGPTARGVQNMSPWVTTSNQAELAGNGIGYISTVAAGTTGALSASFPATVSIAAAAPKVYLKGQ